MEKPRKGEQMSSKTSSFMSFNEVTVDAIEAAAEVAQGLESKKDELLTVLGKNGLVWSVIGVDHSVKFPADEEVDPLVEEFPESHDKPSAQISW